MMVYIIDGSIGSFNPHLIPTYKPSIATVTGSQVATTQLRSPHGSTVAMAPPAQIHGFS